MLTPYRVLDLTDEKGLLCSKLLADMGAEVIRIDRPGETVPALYANTGKHCLSLNMASLKGSQILKSIIRDTDIVVESFAPGYLDSLGLGYPVLSTLNKRVIMASITNFGQSGPYRDKKSSDLVSSALGGQAYVCGEPGLPPLKPFGTQTYFTASLFAANGILLALWGRHASGKGQYIDISIQECTAATLDHVLVRYFYNGVVANRTGQLYWNQAFRIFPCQDGYVLLSFLQHWETLIEILDSEGLAGDLKDARWSREDERRNNIDHISGILENWTRRHTAAELVEMGQLMRFPWAKADSIPEVVNNPQLRDREYFVETHDSGSDHSYLFPGAPVRMSGTPWQANTLLPVKGDYNYEVLHNRLGLSDQEIEELAREGVV